MERVARIRGKFFVKHRSIVLSEKRTGQRGQPHEADSHCNPDQIKHPQNHAAPAPRYKRSSSSCDIWVGLTRA